MKTSTVSSRFLYEATNQRWSRFLHEATGGFKNSERGDSRAAPFNYELSVLEVELKTKLNKSRLLGRGDASKVSRTDTSIRITKVRVIEDVEELRSEFDDLVLTNLRALHQGNVEVDIARSMEHVTTEAAESAGAIEQGRRVGCADSTEVWIRRSRASTTARSVKGTVR